MRKDFMALAVQAEAVLKQDQVTGHLFFLRGRRGNLVKVIWWDGQGACVLMKRLEMGRFVSASEPLRVCRETSSPKTIRVDQGSEFVSRDLDL